MNLMDWIKEHLQQVMLAAIAVVVGWKHRGQLIALLPRKASPATTEAEPEQDVDVLDVLKTLTIANRRQQLGIGDELMAIYGKVFTDQPQPT